MRTRKKPNKTPVLPKSKIRKIALKDANDRFNLSEKILDLERKASQINSKNARTIYHETKATQAKMSKFENRFERRIIQASVGRVLDKHEIFNKSVRKEVQKSMQEVHLISKKEKLDNMGDSFQKALLVLQQIMTPHKANEILHEILNTSKQESLRVLKEISEIEKHN